MQQTPSTCERTKATAAEVYVLHNAHPTFKKYWFQLGKVGKGGGVVPISAGRSRSLRFAPRDFPAGAANSPEAELYPSCRSLAVSPLLAANFYKGHQITLVILLSVSTFETFREMVAAYQWESRALT